MNTFPWSSLMAARVQIALSVCWLGIVLLHGMPLGIHRAGETLNRIVSAAGALDSLNGAGPLLHAYRSAGVAGSAAMVLFSAIGAGSPVVRWLAPSLAGPFRCVVGFGIGALLTAAAGFAGLLFSPLLQGAMAVAVVAGLAGCWREWGSKVIGYIKGPRRTPSMIGIVTGASFAIWCGLAAIPDTLEDSLVYHWALPEFILGQGRLLGMPQHIQWHYPLNVEMIYTVGLAVGGASMIKAANLALAVTCLMLVARFSRRLFPAFDGSLAVAFFASAPAITHQVWVAKSDLGLVMFLLAGLLAPLEIGIRSPAGGVLAGCLMGLAAGVKYTAVFSLVGLAAWFAMLASGRYLRVGRWIIAAAGFAWLPWGGRNYLGAGNPLFPYAHHWFGGLLWSESLEAAVHRAVGSVTPSEMTGGWYWLGVWQDVCGNPEYLGLPLAVLGPAILVTLMKARLGIVTVLSVVTMLATLHERNPRFLLPASIVLAVGAGQVYARFRSTVPRLAPVVLTFLLAGGLFLNLSHTLDSVPTGSLLYAVGQVDERQLQSMRYTSYGEVREWANAHAGKKDRIWLFGEHRRFGFENPIWSEHIVTAPAPWRWATESRDPAHLFRKWRQAGAKLVIENVTQGRYRQMAWFSGLRWTPQALHRYEDFARGSLTRIHRSPREDFQNGFFLVSRVETVPHVPQPYVDALPWTEAFLLPARKAVAAGRARDAVTLAEQALNELPHVLDVHAQAGFVFHLIGDWERSAREHRLLASHGYAVEGSLYYEAIAELNLGRHRAAFGALRRALRAGPREMGELNRILAVALSDWGRVRILAGNKRGAEECDHLARLNGTWR